MKAAINNGFIRITAETSDEATALQSLYPLDGKFCHCCGQMDHKVLVDVTVLTNTDTSKGGE